METEVITDTGRGLSRALRILSIFGEVDGWLQMGAVGRTLDDLNAPAQDEEVPRGTLETVHYRGGPLALNKAAVLFVTEREDWSATRPRRIEAALFTRAAIALWIGEYQISGFVHVPRGDAALARLNQMAEPFLAVTSASVTGPGGELSFPFVAVNRARILAVEDLLPDGDSLKSLSFDEVEPAP